MKDIKINAGKIAAIVVVPTLHFKCSKGILSEESEVTAVTPITCGWKKLGGRTMTARSGTGVGVGIV